MSRVATAPTPTAPAMPLVAREKIAMRAYEKWVKRGRPAGTDLQDWLEAETELKSEMNRTMGTAPSRR